MKIKLENFQVQLKIDSFFTLFKMYFLFHFKYKHGTV